MDYNPEQAPPPDGPAVRLHLYDISRGLASRLAPALIGKEVRGRKRAGFPSQKVSPLVPHGPSRHAPETPAASQVEGLWHVNVVIGDEELSYGPPLRRFPAGQGWLGAPARVLDLGYVRPTLRPVGVAALLRCLQLCPFPCMWDASSTQIWTLGHGHHHMAGLHLMHYPHLIPGPRLEATHAFIHQTLPLSAPHTRPPNLLIL